MTEQEALQRARQILDSDDQITAEVIDEFYSLEPFIEPFKFGGLIEALIAITPSDLLQYV